MSDLVLFDNVIGRGIVLKRLHGAGRASLAEASHSVGVAKKFSQRSVSFDNGIVSAVFGSCDDTSPLLQVVDEITKVFFRGCQFQPHDRFQQHGLSISECLFKGIGGCDPKGHIGRLFIEPAIHNRHFDPR